MVSLLLLEFLHGSPPRFWAPFYHSNHTMDLLLGKICHSQGLEIGLAELGLMGWRPSLLH